MHVFTTDQSRWTRTRLSDCVVFSLSAFICSDPWPELLPIAGIAPASRRAGQTRRTFRPAGRWRRADGGGKTGLIVVTLANSRFKPCAALLALGTAACAGPQSTLDPAGPAAGAIATTWWIMFGTAAVVWTIVMVLLLLAMQRRRSLATRPATTLVVVGGAVVPTLLLAALLIYGTRTSDRATGRGVDVDHVVRVTARQWQWEFEHLDADGDVIAMTVDHLVLPLGAMVEFHVGSVDVIHSFWIPRLGGKIDAIPGRGNVVRLRADRAGPMRGQCAEFCGLEHARMGFDVDVLEPAAFDAWLSRNAVDTTSGGTP